MKLAILALFVMAVVAIMVTDAKAAEQTIEPQLPKNIDTLNRKDGKDAKQLEGKAVASRSGKSSPYSGGNTI